MCVCVYAGKWVWAVVVCDKALTRLIANCGYNTWIIYQDAKSKEAIKNGLEICNCERVSKTFLLSNPIMRDNSIDVVLIQELKLKLQIVIKIIFISKEKPFKS